MAVLTLNVYVRSTNQYLGVVRAQDFEKAEELAKIRWPNVENFKIRMCM